MESESLGDIIKHAMNSYVKYLWSLEPLVSVLL